MPQGLISYFIMIANRIHQPDKLNKKFLPNFFSWAKFFKDLAPYLAEISAGGFPRLFNYFSTTFITLFIIYLYLLYIHTHTYWSYFIPFHIHYYTIQYYYKYILIHEDFPLLKISRWIFYMYNISYIIKQRVR